MVRTIISGLYILVALSLPAAAQDLTFTTIDKGNGLINNYVEHVYEDCDGFVWFGTHSGLMRYDGQRFQLVSLPNQHREVTLNFARQYITYITQDDSSNLWIGSLTGLYRYSPQTQQFEIFEHQPSDHSSLSNNYIEEILLDRKRQCLWVATGEGLNRFDMSTRAFTRYMHEGSDSRSIADNHIFTLAQDARGDLWVGTKGGLERLDAATGSFSHYYRSGKGIDAVNIRSLLFDSDSTLWAVAPHEGLYRKSKGSHVFVRQPLRYLGKDISAPFSDILDDGAGNIWIGTNGDGLFVFNKRTQETTSYQDEIAPPYAICGKSIDRLSRDRQGNVWIATHGGGVSVYQPFKNAFKHYAKNFQPGSLTYNILSCFAQDHAGTMWIGTDGGGLCRMSGEPAVQFRTFDKGKGLSSNAVLAVKEVEPGILAVATWNGGLNLFDSRTGKFTRYTYSSQRLDAGTQDIYDLRYDAASKKLWCCTYYDGIQVFDVAARSFVPEYKMAAQYCNWNASKFCNKVMFSQEGDLWINEGQGLSRLKNKSGGGSSCDSLSFYTETAFPSDIVQLRDGTIWATNHKGIYEYRQSQDTFLLVEYAGMDFSDAKSILQDSAGTVWVATSSSLFRYSPADKTFRNISRYWGIPDLQYYPKAAYRDSSGRLYFGSLSGLLILHEDSLYNTRIEPRLYVTRIAVHSDENQPVQAAGSAIDATYADTVVLNYDQSFITIEYCAANYIDNSKTQFRYLLEGFDRDWTSGSADRTAIYTNIPPGNYTFRLMCTDSQGHWSGEVKTVSIIILPPWWATWWFLTLSTACVLFIAAYIVVRRESAIKKQNKYLESIVRLKTSELTEKNTVLTDQKMTIEASYEKLREKQQVIEIKNTQLQDALITKDKLLTVIAHDFKNPLNTLQGFAKMLRNKIYAANLDELKPNIDKIASSADSLMRQMVEVLDWSISGEDAVKYQPADTNMEVLLLDVLLLTSESAQQKDITISTINNCTYSAYVDPRQISTVLRNLIINSLKFTPPHGTIEVTIGEQAECVMVTVADSGQGMSAEQIDAIMTSKKLLSSDYQSGFGLQICKTFIARNQGTFVISSQIGNGSQFIVSLPRGSKLAASAIMPDRHTEPMPAPQESPASDRSMLIIDDEPDVAAYLREVFALNYTVHVAYNGLDGVNMAQSHIPDIILSDINMPHIDGKQLCQQLKHNPFTCHIPIILISGQALPQNQIDGYLHGADDYIVKPFDVELLKHKITATLNNRELLKARFSQNIEAASASKLPESIEDKIIGEIHRLIMDNLTNPAFSVETLAESACMSRSQLYRKTKAVLGQTPIEYINNLKFVKAMEMIRTGRYRVSEIAYELGFSDVRHFSSSFSKKYGGPPSSFSPKSDA